jgi:DNA-binding IclR family transcriptional regulator
MKTSELATMTGRTNPATVNLLNKLKEQGFVRSSSYGMWEYIRQMPLA